MGGFQDYLRMAMGWAAAFGRPNPPTRPAVWVAPPPQQWGGTPPQAEQWGGTPPQTPAGFTTPDGP